jgi:hypothetical protein
MLPQRQWQMRTDVTAPGQSWLLDTDRLILSGHPQEFPALPAENATWILPEQHVARILAETLGSIPEVQSVCASFGEVFTVWTLLKERDTEARQRVYDKEIQLCDALNVHDFDFRVSTVGLVAPEELTRTGLFEIFRR